MRQVFCVPTEQALPPPIREDEFECLNLVVSVPVTVLKNPENKVPVLVYLHGMLRNALTPWRVLKIAY